jgi:hypothetical protein
MGPLDHILELTYPVGSSRSGSSKPVNSRAKENLYAVGKV